MGLQHLIGTHDYTVAGSFRTNQGTAPGDPFAGKRAGIKTVCATPILTKHETDLAGADADVAGRNVRMLTNVAVQFGHKRLAEPHDFTFGASRGIEISSAFGTTNWHAGQGVFEYLLEPEKYHDAQVHGRVETNATFVRTTGRIELHAETAVDFDYALVVHPGDTENDLALWLDHASQNAVLDIFGMTLHNWAEAGEDFIDRLKEFGFTRVAAQYFFSNLG